MDSSFEWSNDNGCYHNFNVIKPKYKSLIAFDFDDTLVNLKTKKILPNVKEVLNEWYEKKYQIVVFSNQMGITKNKTTHEEVHGHFENFMKIVNIPIIFYYSINNDKYRKPSNGMYNLATITHSRFGSYTLKTTNEILFYCGDAAGRDKDFSSSDLYFANNCNISFKTPEEVFHNKIEVIKIKDTPKLVLYKDDIWKDGILSNPRKLFDIVHINKDNELIPELDVSKQLLVYMIGSMGLGKSSLSSILSDKYNLEIINLDTNILKIIKSKINIGYKNKSGIIIDNCNSTIKNRDYWHKLALKNSNDFNIYYIHFDIPKPISIHLTRYRTYCNNQIDKYKYDSYEYNKFNKNIPVVAIHKYYKSFELPNKEEGTIITIKSPLTLMKDYNHNYRFCWN